MSAQDIRLLLVEDTATLAFAYASHLRNEGLEVETVGTAADAMYAVTLRRYAAVILDMYLPDGHGLEILAHINEVSPESSVIVVTADDSDESLRQRASGRGTSSSSPLPTRASLPPSGTRSSEPRCRANSAPSAAALGANPFVVS